jgi:hypothetical protein
LNTKDKRISAFRAIAISKFENPMSKEYLVITKVPYYRRYIFSENVEKLIEKKNGIAEKNILLLLFRKSEGVVI